jgi:hypothetical protein
MRVHALICGRRDVGPLRAAVGGELNQAVAGARPQHIDIERRGRERGDGSLGDRSHRGRVLAGVRGHVPGLAREIAADGGPAMTAVGGLPDAGGRKKRTFGSLGDQIRGCVRTVRAAADRLLPLRRLGLHVRHAAASSAARADAGLLPGHAVVNGHFSAVHQVGILRIGSGFAVFSMPTGCQSWNVISPSMPRLSTQADPESCWPLQRR